MDYFLFNKNIWFTDGGKARKIEPDALKLLGPQSQQIHICVVETDTVIASALESALDKKDSILAKKFAETFPGEYALQDQRIGHNLFQVMGIKSEKVREVYSLIPNENIVSFVPYAVAIRGFLTSKGVAGDQPIVFIDDFGEEKLLTVFDGLKFSRTRTIFNHETHQILPEIKRSAINFEKKLGEAKSNRDEGYLVLTNNQDLTDALRQMEKDLRINTVESDCPAIDGLKAGGFNIKYVLPEEILRKKRAEENEKRIGCVALCGVLLMLSIFYYFYNQAHLTRINLGLSQEQARRSHLELSLNALDPWVYRSGLRQEKKINYPLVYWRMSRILPLAYEIYSFDIFNEGKRPSLDAYLYTADGQFYENLPDAGVLRNAQVKNFWINNRPGKYVRILL